MTNYILINARGSYLVTVANGYTKIMQLMGYAYVYNLN
jgi:hypothetical protein